MDGRFPSIREALGVEGCLMPAVVHRNVSTPWRVQAGVEQPSTAVDDPFRSLGAASRQWRGTRSNGASPPELPGRVLAIATLWPSTNGRAGLAGQLATNRLM